MTERLLTVLAFAAGALLFVTPAGADDSEPPEKTAELLERGRVSFLRNCALCHGEKGAGDGFAAASINPKPRNFGTDPFKNGSKPRQIFATLETGVPGTAMLPFRHIPEDERWALAYWVAELKAMGKKKK